jgi:AbrB family transcriptional regulator (stage V sporulation protein T)
MTKSGMIRRIDELGRVVVPKEMRKTLMIEKGDTVEIFVENAELKIKKYSPLSNIKTFACLTAEILGKNTKKSCIITDTDFVLGVYDKSLKPFVGEKVSDDLIEIMRKGKMLNVKKGQTQPISMLKENIIQVTNQIIVPVVKVGDVFGSVILFNNDENDIFTECDLRLTELSANFLSKQFEI